MMSEYPACDNYGIKFSISWLYSSPEPCYAFDIASKILTE